jgi:hypothetical protein
VGLLDAATDRFGGVVTMVATSIARGFRTAFSEWRLPVILWLFGLLVPLALVVPVATWMASATARFPGADALLDGFDVAAFTDLVVNHEGAWSVVFGLTFTVFVLARVGQAFVLGGIVEVLRGEPNVLPPAGDLVLEATPPVTPAEAATAGSPGDAPAAPPVFAMPAVAASTPRRSTMHRFFRGAGRFFLRNLVMLVLTAIGLLLLPAALYLLFGYMVKPLEGTTSEALAWLRVLLPPIAGGLGAVFFLLVFDYACIRLVCERSHRPFSSWFSALAFVGRRFPSTLALWVLPGLLAAAALLLYFGYSHAVPGVTGGRILALVIVQQLVVLVRAVVRAATVAAELHYSSTRRFVSARGAGVAVEGVPA